VSAQEEKAALQVALDKAIIAYRENPTEANKQYHDYVGRRWLTAACQAEIEELTGRPFDA
jgi:hypothetical protein